MAVERMDEHEIQLYLDTLTELGRDISQILDEYKVRFQKCRDTYSRAVAEFEEKRHSLQMQQFAIEQQIQMAQNTLDMSESRNDESRNGSTAQDLQRYEDELQSVMHALKIVEANAAALQSVWENEGNSIELSLQDTEEISIDFSKLSMKEEERFSDYLRYCEQIKQVLNQTEGFNTQVISASVGKEAKNHFTSSNNTTLPSGSSFINPAVENDNNQFQQYGENGRIFQGWCPKNHFRFVTRNESGDKVFLMSIGGNVQDFSCSVTGAAKAYRAALRSGDRDLINRTSAIYEVEVLRCDLDLGDGSSLYPQLGGYHIDVSKQDPPDFQSHHIPARSIQDEDAQWLPSISLSQEDHSYTASYANKQHIVYQSPLGSRNDKNYKQETEEMMSMGGIGYIQLVKDEVLDLVKDTGHRYDGGISAYLDAVIDMLAGRGIPSAKQ